MVENLVASLAERLRIDKPLARQSLAMMMETLHEHDDGELAGELDTQFPSLGNLEGPNSGGGVSGLAGEAAGLMSGTPDSGLHGLKVLLGENRLPEFAKAVSGVVEEHGSADLGNRTLSALQRIIG